MHLAAQHDEMRVTVLDGSAELRQPARQLSLVRCAGPIESNRILIPFCDHFGVIEASLSRFCAKPSRLSDASVFSPLNHSE
jgi:hypothetical protein